MTPDNSEALTGLTLVAQLVRANVGDLSYKQWLLQQCVAESLFPQHLLAAAGAMQLMPTDYAETAVIAPKPKLKLLPPPISTK